MRSTTLLHALKCSARYHRNEDRARRQAGVRREALRSWAIERMEERTLLSTFTVTNTDDNGNDASPVPDSLRAAILAANADTDTAGTSIVFSIPAPGVQTIQPLGAGLPVITHSMLIDGWSQGGSGYAGSPLIELDGSQGATYGLAIAGADCTLRGLAINRFVTDRFINQGVVSFFGSYGIFSAGADAVIEGCFIGTDATGTQALPNTNGLWVSGTGSLIGSNGDGINDVAERNVISGNSNVGVVASGDGIVVAGNYIGTDVYGTSALGNKIGVQITGPSTLGFDGTAANPGAQRNVISGNALAGVQADDRAVIAGNYIGTGMDGEWMFGADGQLLGNGWGYHGSGGEEGIALGNDVLLGTNADGVHDADERNVISGNSRANVDFGGSDSVVAGNYIGTTKEGTWTAEACCQFSTSGVTFESGAHDNRLGTDGMKGSRDEAERNIISGNGINVQFGGSWNNVVAGNYIGPDKDGENTTPNGVPMPNGLGMFVNGTNNRIGTNGDGNGDADERNVISGNLGNTVSQIWINNAPGTVVAGNYIGTDASGTRSLTQAGNAILVQGAGAAGTMIGDNLISGINGGAAVALVQATSVQVAENLIGVAKDGTTSLADTDGIRVVDSTDIQIDNNVMAFIPSFGVSVRGESYRVSIRANSIHDTGDVGIDLGEDGLTLNDSHTHTSGPNFWQNFPILSAAYAGDSTVVTGTLNTTPSSTITLDFYANATPHPSGYGEGQTYLGSTTVTTDASGNASFTSTGLAATSPGQWMSATATDASGDTSEFSLDVQVIKANTATALTSSANPSFLGLPVTFTATVAPLVPASGVPTGTITFLDGPTVIDTETLSGGTASFTSATMTSGNHSITSIYSGDAVFRASTSTVLTQTIIPPSILVLNPTAGGALTLSGNASINIPGTVAVDSSSSTALSLSGNAHLTASVIDVLGGFKKSGNATSSPAPTTGVYVPDPFASLASPNTTGVANHGSEGLSGNSRATISPGIYSQITVSGNASLTLSPGAYIIEGGGLTVTGNASVSGYGVMIYNAGSNYPSSGGAFGGITLGGNGTFSMTAATTGTYAGILIFQSRQNTRALSFSGNAMLGMTGTIYAPSALLSMSGNAQLQNPLIVDSLNLSGNVGLTQTADGSDATGDTSGIANTLLAGNLSVYINDPNGDFTTDELTRIQDAINTWNAILAPYNVIITEVSDPNRANVVIDTGTTSACGGATSGVLGCYDSATGEITLIQNWSWYAGADPGQIGAGQYDYETTVTHELGHALGLGHSTDPSSPMFATLATGVADRIPSIQDLNIPDPPEGADPQMAAGFTLGAPLHFPVTTGYSGAIASPTTSSTTGLMPLASISTLVIPGKTAAPTSPMRVANYHSNAQVGPLHSAIAPEIDPDDRDPAVTEAVRTRVSESLLGDLALAVTLRGRINLLGPVDVPAPRVPPHLHATVAREIPIGKVPMPPLTPERTAGSPAARPTDILLAAGFFSFGAATLTARRRRARPTQLSRRNLPSGPRV